MAGTLLMLVGRWREARNVFNEASRIVDERPAKRFKLFNHMDPFVQWAGASWATGELLDLVEFIGCALS